MKRKMLAFIPNLITLLNLLMGCFAIKFIFDNEPIMAVICIAIGLLADFLDGAVARMLKVSSELGKQLDSLADMVTFGVVPGMLLYYLLSQNSEFPYLGFILPLFAALRLGKFNLDTRQSDHFIGLPTPACTIFVVGLLLIYEWNTYDLATITAHPTFLIATIIILSYLLVAELPLFSLKFKNLAWKTNEVRFSFVAVSLLLLLLFREVGLILSILIYLLLSIFQNFISKDKV